jgi:hypothetical protein
MNVAQPSQCGDFAWKWACPQAASRYLKALVSVDVLREQSFGREKVFVHPNLMSLLTRDDNGFKRYFRE